MSTLDKTKHRKELFPDCPLTFNADVVRMCRKDKCAFWYHKTIIGDRC